VLPYKPFVSWIRIHPCVQVRVAIWVVFRLNSTWCWVRVGIGFESELIAALLLFWVWIWVHLCAEVVLPILKLSTSCIYIFGSVYSRERESGELLIWYLSVHIISFEDSLKKEKKNKKKKEKKEKKRKGADLCVVSDEDINTDPTSTPSTPTPAGPITHARARKVNHQVSSFLSSCPSCLDLGDTYTLVLIRNQGEDRKGKGLA
jgi:hypothetical protein